MGFLEDYFINPIFDKTGYNAVNTLVYAAIAIGALYLIYKRMERAKFSVSREFWIALLGFVVLGSSMRVVTDSVDSGVMGKFVAALQAGAGGGLVPGIGGALLPAYSAVLSSHAFDYGYWTVTPGIYLVTAALFLVAILIGRALGRGGFAAYAGWMLASFPVLLLLPMAVHFGYALAIVALAAVAAISMKHLLKFSWKNTLPVFAHAFDGAATWVAINWFGPAQGVAYFEQHVLSGGIGTATPLGFGLFFILKVAFASAAVHYLAKDGEKEGVPPLAMELTLCAITVLGLAPGLRDMLRLLLGT